jgi:phage shock protein PspC (stress-responsive transcriptional regulator)
MLPANYPAYPPVIILALLFAVELGFGFFFNWFFRYIRLNVALAVVAGVFMTGLIMYPFIWAYVMKGEQFLLIMLIAFAGSGAPMAILSIRTEKAQEHKRRPMPNWVMHVCEDANRKLYCTIKRIEETTLTGTINAAFLVTLTNELYEIGGVLDVCKNR